MTSPTATQSIADGVAIHRRARVEKGAVVKGPAIIGDGANIEAGAVIANHRNEQTDKRIRIRAGAEIIDTGVDKFGTLVGDGARIGANAVIAPGAVVPRLALVDQGAD
ncbi:MAG: hypothetical protein ACK4NP_12770 [Parvularculaceae bacterium]